MAKRAIDCLIDSAAFSSRQPIKDRLSAKQRAAIESDMAAIIGAEKAGKAVPSRPVIAKYLREEYGAIVGRTTIGEWLHRLRNGSPMW